MSRAIQFAQIKARLKTRCDPVVKLDKEIADLIRRRNASLKRAINAEIERVMYAAYIESEPGMDLSSPGQQRRANKKARKKEFDTAVGTEGVESEPGQSQ